MDQHSLARRLFGKAVDQGGVVGRTRTYFGTALSDSRSAASWSAPTGQW